MSDGWIHVTGRRSFKPSSNNRNPSYELKEIPSDPDEGRIQQHFDRIRREIYNVYHNERSFLSRLLTDLKKGLKSKKVYVYALGCGSVENTSLVLSKSCLYQWSVCIIMSNILNVSKTHIFDPLMTKNDWIVWEKLLNHHYDFKYKQSLLTDTQSDSTSSDTSIVSASVSDTVNILLWMPHCEKFLYKAVLQGIFNNRSPIRVCKSLSRKRPLEHSNPDDQCKLDEEDPNSSSNDSKLYPDTDSPEEIEYYEPESYSLESTILVGNSLSRYSEDDPSLTGVYQWTETQLPPFETHDRSFNDTFITFFSKPKL